MHPNEARQRFEAAMRWLSSFTDWEQRLHEAAGRETFDLRRMETLLERLGRPDEGLPVIHVTGTKGKTSFTYMADAILDAHGLRAVRFVSPHVTRVHERLAVGGVEVDDLAFSDLVLALKAVVEPLRDSEPHLLPSFFESMTLMAFLLARHSRAQALVLEVGLGGRLDATNVVDPVVSVITSVGLEHQRILGDTVEQIAEEKAGILKPGREALFGLESDDPARPVLDRVAGRVGCRPRGPESLPPIENLEWIGDRERGPRIRFDLGTGRDRIAGIELRAGADHQAANARLAVTACEVLLRQIGRRLDADSVRQALSRLDLPGRAVWRPGNPPLLLDGAHTRESLDALFRLVESMRGGGRLHVVFAAMRDKDPADLLRPHLPRIDRLVLTTVDSPRAWPVTELREALSEAAPDAIETPGAVQALSRAREGLGPDDLVLVAGSLYLVGALLASDAVHDAPDGAQ